jgi:purine-nucleoside phosphorylase
VSTNEAKSCLESRLGGFKPQIGIVLGSGLTRVTEKLESRLAIPYADVAGFKTPSVPGHAGRLVFGTIKDKPLAILEGRLHAYEGYSMAEVTFPIRVLDAIGCKILVVTNSAGAIHTQLTAGSLMLIEDHINFMGDNPLVGLSKGNGSIRFLDMTQAYSSRLREKMMAAAAKQNIDLKLGVYLAVKGPSYETPAEVKAFAWMGADAIGMSTVPEVLVARAVGLEVVGISCISNVAAGLTAKKLSHEDVLTTANALGETFARLIEEFLGTL